MKTKTASLGLDIGGTNIRAGVVAENANLVGEIQSSESPSQKSSEQIISNFMELATNTVKKAEDEGYIVNKCGVGIPDPFDYENGISLMKHKFQAILTAKRNYHYYRP